MVDSALNNPYQDQEYQKQRDSWFKVIPKSALLSAVGRNAWTVTYALTTTAVAAIVMGIIHVPVWGIAVMAGGALIAAAVNAYAAYKDEKMSKTVDLGYRESRQIADARVLAKEYAKEMSIAIKDTLGAELKDVRKESHQTQAVVAHLQKQMLSWQEREAQKEETQQTLVVLQ